MDEDDDENCSTCANKCTCRAQCLDACAPVRGGGKGKSGKGKARALMPVERHTSPSTSSLSSQRSPTPTSQPPPKPIKIKLTLKQVSEGQRDRSPLPNRRQRSTTYTSSSSESLSDNVPPGPPKPRAKPIPDPPPILPSSRTSIPSRTSNSHSNAPKRRGRPPKALVAAREAAARVAAQNQGVYKEAMFGRPIRASANSTSSSQPLSTFPSSSRTSSSSKKSDFPKPPQPAARPQSKPKPTTKNPYVSVSYQSYPSSALHAPGRTKANQKPSHNHPRSQPNAVVGRVSSQSSRPVTLQKKTPSQALPAKKNAGVSNPKKRRRDTPSPSPPPDDSTSTDELTPSDDDRFDEDLVSSRTSAYPTFISASSSSESSSLTEESTDDEDSDIDVGDDADLRKEEERMLVRQALQRERARKKKEKETRRGGGWYQKHERHQEEAVIKDTPSSGGNSNVSASVASDEDDEDESEADNEDPDHDAEDLDATASAQTEWVGVGGGFTDTDEEMDAELFFANFLGDDSSDDNASKAATAGQQEPDADGDDESFSSDDEMEFDASALLEHGHDRIPLSSKGPLLHPHITRASTRPHSHVRPTSKKRKRRAVGASRKRRSPIIIAEDSDGQLVFADGFKVGEGAVDMDFEQRRLEMRKVMGEYYDSSDESEGQVMSGVEESGHAPVLPPEEPDTTDMTCDKDGVSETETDFGGYTTVDEGLDEDGLPPPKYPTHHHIERYDYRGSGDYDYDDVEFTGIQDEPNSPLSQFLPPGVELYQSEVATVMYGRSDFPSTSHTRMNSQANNSSTAFQSRKRSASAPHLDGASFTLSPTALHTINPFSEKNGSSLVPESPVVTSPFSPSPADILSGRWTSGTRDRRASVAATSSVYTRLDGGLSLGSGSYFPLLKPSMPEEAPATMRPGDATATSPIIEEPLTPSPSRSPPRTLPKMGVFTLPRSSSSPPAAPQAVKTIPPASNGITVIPRSSKRNSRASSKEPAADIACPKTPAALSIKTFAFPRRKSIAIIKQDGVATVNGVSHESIPSPFANVKRRKKTRSIPPVMEESEGSVSVFSGGHRHSRFRARTGSMHSNYSQSFSGCMVRSTPMLDLDSFTSSPPNAFDMQASGSQSLFEPMSSLFPSHSLLPPASIELADVVDSSFLDDDVTMGMTHGDDHVRNLSRWERVPMGTFRRSRAFGSVGGSTELSHGHQGSPPNQNVSDGFSYGAQSRGTIPEELLERTLWSEGANPRSARDAKGKGRASTDPKPVKRTRRRVKISPVIFPVRGGSPIGELELDGDGDTGMRTGVDEEEGYFSKKTSKGGREGSLRGRKQDKTSRPPTKKARLASIMEVVASSSHSAST